MMGAALAGCGSEPRGSGSDTATARAPAPRVAPSESALSGPLQPADFVVASLDPEPGVDSAGVLAVLGPPDRIAYEPDPWDSAGLRVWHYGSRGVAIDLRGTVQAIRITGPASATARGVRVGDPVERVRAAYGERHGGARDEWRYDDDSDPSGLHGIVFRTSNDRVATIHLGTTGYDSPPPPWEWAFPPWLLTSQGLGPITRRTSERDLIELVGEGNVESVNLSEAPEPEEDVAGTIVFPERLDARLTIAWRDRGRTTPTDFFFESQILEDGELVAEVARGSWRTPRGVRLGTTLVDLQRLNGRPFTVAHVAGTYWEARVASWEGGDLSTELDLRPFVVTVASSGLDALTAEQRRQLDASDTLSSALPALRALNPTVTQIRLRFR